VCDPANSVLLVDKAKIVKALILQHAIVSTITELDQMKEGLSAQKFDKFMRKNPGLLLPVFETRKVKLTSNVIIEDLYCRNNTIFSARGMGRIIEETIFAEWVKYVKELEGTNVI